MNTHKGGAYRVVNKRTGAEVTGAFVLLPEKDSAARTALAAYAEATANSNIAKFIRRWLERIHHQRMNDKLASDGRVGIDHVPIDIRRGGRGRGSFQGAGGYAGRQARGL